MPVSAAARASQTQAHILLVDDNEQGQTVRKAVLMESGYRVTTAKSAEDAIETYLAAPVEARFDLIVTDFRLPDKTGVDLITAIREQDPNAKVVLLSGFVEPLGLTAETTGANMVLMKNASEAMQLTRAVSSLLRKSSPRKPTGSASARQPRAKRASSAS